jgi:WD40 repeat protein
MSRFGFIRRCLVVFCLPLFLILAARAQQKPVPTDRPELALQLGHSLSVFSLAYSPDGNLLASGGGDGTVKIWNAREHELIRTIPAHSGGVRAVAWRNGSTLASSSDDGTVKFWNIETGNLQRAIAPRAGRKDKSKPAKAYALAFSPNGKMLAVGYGDATGLAARGELILLDADTGKVRRVVAQADAVLAVAFRDESTLASGGSDEAIRLWNVPTGAMTRVLSGHKNAVTTLAWSPDGSTLASGSVDTTVRVWDVRSGSAVQTLTAHSQPVHAVVFSSDGKILASSGIDKRIFLWDARSGRQRQDISALQHVSRALAFAPGKIRWPPAVGAPSKCGTPPPARPKPVSQNGRAGRKRWPIRRTVKRWRRQATAAIAFICGAQPRAACCVPWKAAKTACKA